MTKLIDLTILSLIDWLDCIRSPLSTCKKIFEPTISEKERIFYGLRIWIFAFLLSFSLEILIYYNYGIKLENSFIFSYIIGGFLILLTYSFFTHVSLLIFRIKSSFINTLVIYSCIMGAFSPFILLLNYPSVFWNVILIKKIKDKNIDILNNMQTFNDIANDVSRHTSIPFISSCASILYTLLFILISVLMTYAIIDKYNSNKYRTMLSITFCQVSLLPLTFSMLLKDIIIFLYKA